MKLLICIFAMLTVFNVEAYNPYQIKVLKQQIAQGVKKINVSGADFRGSGGFDASNAHLSLKGINLSNAQLSGAAFNTPTKPASSPFLTHTIGQQTDLTKANFSNALLVSTNFAGAILQGANFAGTDIMFANFAGADLTGANLKGVKNMATAVFCGATMPDGTICSGASCGCPAKK
ncbi:MAG: pentapeptide repeat-containing protein [Candidatus Babeliales bacterium]